VGAVLSIATGAVTALVWSELQSRSALPPRIADFDAVLPAIMVSVFSLVAGSLLTPKRQ
jgi:SSS family solute:Na+ symporter/sodium/proline symporter